MAWRDTSTPDWFYRKSLGFPKRPSESANSATRDLNAFALSLGRLAAPPESHKVGGQAARSDTCVSDAPASVVGGVFRPVSHRPRLPGAEKPRAKRVGESFVT